MDSPSSYTALKVFMALMFVAINAFFVAAEFSIVKIRRSRLEEIESHGNKKAKLAIKITSSLDSYLSATQLGITLASLALGWIGEPALAVIIDPLFGSWLKDDPILMHSLSIAVAFTIITLMHVVFGELVPKSIAIQKTETAVMLVVRPLYLFAQLFRPVIYIFDNMAAFALKLLGIRPAHNSDLVHSEEEIKLIAGASQRGGIIDKTESEIIKNAVDFSDKIAREIMVPRQDMECLYLESSYEENFDIVKTSNHTRYPVCDEDKDNIVGMVHLRDVLMNEGEKDITKMLREVLFVPESLSVSEVLHTMKRRRIHMAIVIDEYGGTSGLISMEDVLEELVGDIQDEHDTTNEVYEKRLDDGTFEFLGMTLLDEAMEYMGLRPLEEHEEDTIGGYVFGLLARKPKVGDVVDCPSCRFEILEIDGFRVKKVKAFLKEPENEEEEDVEEEAV
ncbi:MAG: HlyC/CorC family transporter [Alphaproteobacteria bacterium]|nr:HlyC/CorC family transporter [Alphaproteobacteria bacterium]MBO4643610.1 HlyC/CorC family transporter [Alphaproteobacteria bacterium]